MCNALGVDFTGFIFVPSSPRAVSPAFVGSLPQSPAKRVGVFAGASVEAMLACKQEANLEYLQLHGGESPELCAQLCACVGSAHIIKVLWPENCTQQRLHEEMERFAPVCAYFLLDAGKNGGGSGSSLPFANLADFHPPKPWFMAGGLGLHNLEQAITVCAPDGVDLNSALETAPGIKNPEHILKAISIVTSYNTERTL